MKRALIVFASTPGLLHPSMADEALAKANNCMAATAVDKSLLALAQRRGQKHGNDASKADMLAKNHQGWIGVRLPIPMPANLKSI